ncbi:hypothetical protein [Paenibacillus sp. NAIST15-1]|uniref:hypothetical protein n=1 Tax=Paenibacillus sp. NAIST15-1 TaxID=1605994 RepID=UPI00086D3E42|nr:hypothetical protein [Paenibacillus sp. NAIST15-1]GAV11278.1 copper amine oxidase N-terminal domain-containing protein [Paenibacillus sp. NAIST15-1]
MLNKAKYVVVGAVVGSLLTVSASVFADNIQTLLGKKVDKEYTVKINGKSISDKAIAVDGKAHLPVRSISDALGANVDSVNNGVISLTTKENETVNETQPNDNNTGAYANTSKKDLERLKTEKSTQLKFITDERDELIKRVEQAKKDGSTSFVEENEKIVKDNNQRIEKLQKEIADIESEIAKKS